METELADCLHKESWFRYVMFLKPPQRADVFVRGIFRYQDDIKTCSKYCFRERNIHKLKSLKLIIIALNNCFTQGDTILFSNRIFNLLSFVADEVCLN